MFGKSKTRKKTPKINLSQALAQLGAGVGDLSNGTNNFGRVAMGHQDQLQQQAAQQRQAQLVAQMNGGGPSAQQAAMQLNPQAAAAAIAKQRFGHHTVNGGNSVVTYGPNGQPQMTQAAQNFQHDNKVGTLGPNGQFSVNDLGASQKDMNATMGHNVTAQGNQMDFQQAQMEDGTKRYVSDNSLTGAKYTR